MKNTLGLTIIFLAMTAVATAALDTNYGFRRKYAANVDGYFSTPHLIKARTYWEQYKIIDDTIPATISVADQVEFTSRSETADVYVPDCYDSSHSTNKRGLLDDFDDDGTNNAMEYVLGLDPTTPDASPPSLLVGMNGKSAVLRYRRAATDIQMQVSISTDLDAWDETGSQVAEASSNFDSPAFANCEYQSTLTGAAQLFFMARAIVIE
jgi:hypothetical protein